jgi:2',3'-cyclic-nucleotide 2'-phosphodiesterase (5'-nucleotidase family)
MPRLLHYSDVENAYDDPLRAGRLAGLLRSLSGPDALVVGTGDNTAPGVVALVERGRQALDLFAAVDTAVETFGNHDFDFGPAATRDVVADSRPTWVSANVFDGASAGGDADAEADTNTTGTTDGGGEEGGNRDDRRFGADVGVVPHTVERVDGARVGFFGVTDPATGSLNPMAADVAFTDPLAAAREAVDALVDAGVDHVVALSHLGAGDDALAAVDGVDVVLGGHVHTRRNERVSGVRCTRPGVNGAAVVEVDLAADVATVHETADADPYGPLVDSLRRRVADAGLDEVVARVDEPIVRDRDTVFGGECRVGNLVADAYRWATDADVGLQNSGGIREGPPLCGDVTTGDLVSVVPFEEQVVVAEVTGAELRSILAESNGSRVDFGDPDWWHGHVGGASFAVDAGRVTDVTVGGDPLDPAATYTVGTSDYLLHTDHEFPTLDQHHRAGEAGIQYEVLWAYARANGLDPAVEGRIRRQS